MKTLLLLCASITLFAQKPEVKVFKTRNSGQSSSTGISYHNGPVIEGTANVYYIWYGNWGGSPVPGLLAQFAQSIGGSSYTAISTTYYDKNGPIVTNVSGNVAYMGAVYDSYSLGPAITDSDIGTIVAAQIGSGALPKDVNGVYFVLTSADVQESGPFGSFGRKYCGWHTFQKISRVPIKYAFVGDPSGLPGQPCQAQNPGPNGASGADGMANVVAHELEEAITDPELNAWYTSNGAENEDMCAWTFGPTKAAANGAQYNLTLGGLQWLIQRDFANAGSGYCAFRYPQGSPPVITISSPSPHQTFGCDATGKTEPVTFSATASDAVDGDITPSLSWTFQNGIWPNPFTVYFDCGSTEQYWTFIVAVTNGAGQTVGSSVSIYILPQ